MASGLSFLPFTATGTPLSKVDRDLLHLVGGLLGRNSHPEIDDRHAIHRGVFQLARLVADVQTILVAAVRLRNRRLHGNLLCFAVGDHLRAAGEQVAEFFDSPGGDDLDVRFECFGGQLEPALVVPLAGRTVGVGLGPDFAGDLQADLRDQRPRDRGPQQINPLVLGLPLQHGEGEVAAQFLAGIDELRRLGAIVAGLLENRLAVFARLTQIDIHGMHVVAFVLEPTENHRGIQTSRISQHTTGHDHLPLSSQSNSRDATHRRGNRPLWFDTAELASGRRARSISDWSKR